MLSKVLTEEAAAFAEPFLFQQVGRAPATARREPSASAAGGDTATEAGQLRARIADLERAFAQQSASIRQEALREGEASGRARAEAALTPVTERLGQTIQQLIETKPRLRKQVEEEAVQLALAISRRILRRELSIDPGVLHGLVQAAFERVARQEITRVLVHPDQAALVRTALAASTTRNIEVTPDGSRESGTLIFETTRGSVDASLDSQLREIELGLADRLRWR